MPKLKLVAVHLGASHNLHNEEQIKRIAEQVCEKVMLNHTGDSQESRCAETAVVQLNKLMEDEPLLNCGFGSSLNMQGQVECDASIMSSKSRAWAGVGAVSCCKNPIVLAKALYDARSAPRALNLIQPNLLVGSGAKQWMREHCPELIAKDSQLISANALNLYQKFKSRYDAAIKALANKHLYKRDSKHDSQQKSSPPPNDTCKSAPKDANNAADSNDESRVERDTQENNAVYSADIKLHPPSDDEAPRREQRNNSSSDECASRGRLDTVGAVAVDDDNTFACAVSSGGLALKYKGRVGQAAIPGAGSWAECGIACATTGVGEYLTCSLLARKFCEKINTLRMLYDLGRGEEHHIFNTADLIFKAVHECFKEVQHFAVSEPSTTNFGLAGLLSVCSLSLRKSCVLKSTGRQQDHDNLYLSYAHNTKSMCIAYMTSYDETAHCIMSRIDDATSNNASQTQHQSRAADKDVTTKDSVILVKTIKFSLLPQQQAHSTDQGDEPAATIGPVL